MITKELFGKKPCGCEVYLYTLKNSNGAYIEVLTMGGILRKIVMPDRNGNFGDVICGFDSVEDYLNGGGYQGALIGRYGNRIGDGKFTLNGVTYQLALNEKGVTHLHGGDKGFNVKIWEETPFEKKGECGIILKMTSPDGDENFPGRLDVTVTYSLTDANELKIHYEAVTDKDTIVNMTNHAYFNLGGYNSGTVLDHTLTVDADAITEIDNKFTATGNAYPVDGTPFDFRQPHKIGERINCDDEQLRLGGGYDHNFILNKGMKYGKAVTLYDEKSGRGVDVYTSEPGVQVYSGNMMDGAVPFKGGYKQTPRNAVCLETQHAPDSPNHDNFPTTVLKVGEKYDTTTVYAFFVK